MQEIGIYSVALPKDIAREIKRLTGKTSVSKAVFYIVYQYYKQHGEKP